MSGKGVDRRPSETAVFTSLYRALANKESADGSFGPDYLAEHFLPPHFRFFIRFPAIRARARRKFNRLVPGMYEYMIARTAFFDRMFIDALNGNTPQIVLLGAGYDSRAYRFDELNSSTRIFELDIAPTQNRKVRCLKKARIDIPKLVSFVPIDFNNESLKELLEEAGYKNSKKTLFLWEGVSYYLDPESVDRTLEFVSRSQHSDSVISFDYAVSISNEKADDCYGARELAQTMRKHHSDERFRFSVGEGEIESFLDQRGLKLISQLDNKEIEQAFLIDQRGSLTGQIVGVFRFVSASPKKIE